MLKIVIREEEKCDRVDVGFDVYREGSIKDAERMNRGSGSGVKFRSLATGHKVKQCRSLLSEAQNKTMLIEFITEEWKSNESKSMIGQNTLFVTCGQKCWRIGQMGASLVKDLKSSQEEADTRILLHAKHASDQGYTSVIVASEDTNVFVLLIAFVKEIPASLYQKRGTSTMVRYMDIRKLRAVLGDKLSQALIAVSAFTGCDTVSAFAGRGKKGPLKELKKNEVATDAFVQLGLGTSWNVDESLTSKLQEFTCRMYAAPSKTCKVIILRHEMFLSKRGEVDSSTLPPCEDSLKQHIQRANYQAGVFFIKYVCDNSIISILDVLLTETTLLTKANLGPSRIWDRYRRGPRFGRILDWSKPGPPHRLSFKHNTVPVKSFLLHHLFEWIDNTS